ncbi:hypothetical protein LXA43DRAFT_1149853 [Ganoderma leucocontextum]|nr:hypothetical protein LXA43DRAFT_1149853 [Ganoderma leucocontextum]
MLEELKVEFNDDMFSQEHAPTTFACSQWNIAEQHRLGTWNTLCHVEGTIQDLFLLGLTCAIPELTITIPGVDFEDLHLLRCEAEAWRQIVAYARPETVTLHVHDSDWIVDDHGFSLLSETPQLVSLHSLNVFVHVSYDMGAHPQGMGGIDALDLLWDIVVVWIKPVDLSVTFDWTGWGALARMTEGAGDEGPEPAFPREKLEAVDIEAHACRFVHEHTRSVRYSLVGPGGWRRDTRCFGPGVSPEEQAAVIEEQMEED